MACHVCSFRRLGAPSWPPHKPRRRLFWRQLALDKRVHEAEDGQLEPAHVCVGDGHRCSWDALNGHVFENGVDALTLDQPAAARLGAGEEDGDEEDDRGGEKGTAGRM